MRRDVFRRERIDPAVGTLQDVVDRRAGRVRLGPGRVVLIGRRPGDAGNDDERSLAGAKPAVGLGLGDDLQEKPRLVVSLRLGAVVDEDLLDRRRRRVADEVDLDVGGPSPVERQPEADGDDGRKPVDPEESGRLANEFPNSREIKLAKGGELKHREVPW